MDGRSENKQFTAARSAALFYFSTQIRPGFSGAKFRATAQSKGKSQTCEFGRQNLLTLRCLEFVLTIRYLLFRTAFQPHCSLFTLTSNFHSNKSPQQQCPRQQTFSSGAPWRYRFLFLRQFAFARWTSIYWPQITSPSSKRASSHGPEAQFPCSGTFSTSISWMRYVEASHRRSRRLFSDMTQ